MKIIKKAQEAPAIVTAATLLQVQAGLNSPRQEVVAAAESVLSALVLHLRKTRATLPPGLDNHVRVLQENYSGIAVERVP